ncbi:MAG: hypothetical protein H7222_04080 [Methylotenera sp.]|nr:hypothetical protein [Oligoflexia bacterium]
MKTKFNLLTFSAQIFALTAISCSTNPFRSPSSEGNLPVYADCDTQFSVIRTDPAWQKELLYTPPSEMKKRLQNHLTDKRHCDPAVISPFMSRLEAETRTRQQENVAHIRDELSAIAKYRPPLRELKLIEQQSQYSQITDPVPASEKAELVSLGTRAARERKAACTSVDVRGPMLQHMNNQKDGPWCYAYAASDLLSVALGERVSVFDIINNYNNRLEYKFQQIVGGKDESDLHGGSVTRAATRALKKGLCLESDLPSLKVTDSEGKTLKGLLQLIDERKVTATDFSDELNQIRELFPNIEEEDFEKILKKSGRMKRVDRLVDASCKKRIHVEKDFAVRRVDLEKDLHDEGERMMQELDQLLNQQQIVAIDYDATILHEAYNHDRIRRHASSIVARTWNEKAQSCDYLVRNSWGSGCLEYDPGLGCEKGNVWISADMIRRTVYRLTTIHSN